MKLPPQLHITTATQLCAAMMEPISNCIFVKPKGGLWTSTYCDGSSQWVDAYRDIFADPYARNWFLLTPDPAARVLVVNTVADLKRILRKYPNPLPGTTVVWPDFERIAVDYDAMTLTARGQAVTRLSWPANLYGWDAESTLWFRWKFLSVTQIAPPVREMEIKP